MVSCHLSLTPHPIRMCLSIIFRSSCNIVRDLLLPLPTLTSRLKFQKMNETQADKTVFYSNKKTCVFGESIVMFAKCASLVGMHSVTLSCV